MSALDRNIFELQPLEVRKSCADACHQCAAECEQYDQPECRRCMEACRVCWDECRIVAS